MRNTILTATVDKAQALETLLQQLDPQKYDTVTVSYTVKVSRAVIERGWVADYLPANDWQFKTETLGLTFKDAHSRLLARLEAARVAAS